MGMPRRRWLGIVRKKLFRSLPQETIIVLHTNNTTSSFSEAPTTTRVSTDVVLHNNDNNCGSNHHAYFLTKQEIAAIKIQSCFRGHLARRAFRALKSLVKLQAVVRGVIVRRQARIALHCMHALARLQVTIRARQLLAQ